MAAIAATPLVQSPSAQSSTSSSSSLATLSSPGSATSASSTSSIATINTLELSSSSSDESSNETAIGSTRTTSTRRPKCSGSSSKKERSHFPRHTLLDYDHNYRGTTMRDIAEESTSPNAGPSADQHFVGSSSRQALVRSHTVDSVPRIGLHQLAEQGESATPTSQPGLNQHHPPAARARAHSSRNLSSLGSSAAGSTSESVYPYTSQLPVSSGSTSRRAAGLGNRNISRSPPLSNDILPSQSTSYFETSPNRIPLAQQGCPSSDSEATRHLARLSLSATNPDLSRRQKSNTTSEVGGLDTAGVRNNSGSIDASQRYRKTSLGNAFNPTLKQYQASIPRSQSQYPPQKRTLSEFSPTGSTMPAPLLHSHTVPSGVPTFTNSSASTSRRPTSLVDPYSYSASSAEVNNPNISPNRATRQAYNPSGTSDTLLSAERQSPHQGGSSASGSGYGNSAAGTRYETEREAARSNQLEAKIVLLGRQGVGKTSLVHRYMTGQFSSSLPTTIGASFLVKKLVMDGVKVRLQIWDTAGQERFRSMAPMYYRGAHAAILVYDITSEDSLADVRVWLDELRRNMSSDLIVQIVGNKVDAAHYRKVDLEAAKLQIEKWLVEDDPAAKGRTASKTLSPTRESSGRAGGLPSFGLSRSNSSRSRADTMPSSSSATTLSPASSSLLRINFAASSQYSQANQPDLPAFKDIGISEVSAKADFDESIEDLFLTITSKLVERKVQIEHDRVLRSKDSIMITKEGDNKVQDATRIWGCC